MPRHFPMECQLLPGIYGDVKHLVISEYPACCHPTCEGLGSSNDVTVLHRLHPIWKVPIPTSVVHILVNGQLIRVLGGQFDMQLPIFRSIAHVHCTTEGSRPYRTHVLMPRHFPMECQLLPGIYGDVKHLVISEYPACCHPTCEGLGSSNDVTVLHRLHPVWKVPIPTSVIHILVNGQLIRLLGGQVDMQLPIFLSIAHVHCTTEGSRPYRAHMLMPFHFPMECQWLAGI